MSYTSGSFPVRERAGATSHKLSVAANVSSFINGVPHRASAAELTFCPDVISQLQAMTVSSFRGRDAGVDLLYMAAREAGLELASLVPRTTTTYLFPVSFWQASFCRLLVVIDQSRFDLLIAVSSGVYSCRRRQVTDLFEQFGLLTRIHGFLFAPPQSELRWCQSILPLGCGCIAGWLVQDIVNSL